MKEEGLDNISPILFVLARFFSLIQNGNQLGHKLQFAIAPRRRLRGMADVCRLSICQILRCTNNSK